MSVFCTGDMQHSLVVENLVQFLVTDERERGYIIKIRPAAIGTVVGSFDIGSQKKPEMCSYWSFAGYSKVLDHPGIIVARGWHL
jgi:hypothetical protein